MYFENKLPVKQILLEAITLCFTNYKTLLRFGIPMFVVAALFLPLIGWNGENLANSQTLSFIGIFFLMLILMGVTTAMAAVGCHRTFLLTSEDVKTTKTIRWSMRETRFVGWWMVIGICAMVISIPIMMIGSMVIFSADMPQEYPQLLIYLGFFLIYLPIYYVISRWSLVLPATAIDVRGKSLGWSWGLSEGNGFRLLILLAIFPTAINLALSIIPGGDTMVMQIIHMLLWPVIGAFEICLLSLSYSYLSDYAANKEAAIDDH